MKYYAIVFNGKANASRKAFSYFPMTSDLFDRLKSIYPSEYYQDSSYYRLYEVLDVCFSANDTLLQFHLVRLDNKTIYLYPQFIKDVIEVPDDNKLSDTELIELSMAISVLKGEKRPLWAIIGDPN